MNSKRSVGAGAALVTSLVLLAACGELVADPSFDRWCGEMLCMWQLDEGRIERVETWHVRDYAVELVETGTTLSQLSEEGAVDCLRFAMVVDAEARAGLSLELDFNDDGTIDYTRVIPGVHWKRLSFDIHAPEHYETLRFIVRKAAEGRAVVAQLSARQADDCTGPRVVLDGQSSGAACNDDDACSFGLCEDGRCAACRGDADCAGRGVCVSGACSPCREDGDCGTGERCIWREARSRAAGRTCVPAAQQLERDLLELCDRDRDCLAGTCGVADGSAMTCGWACETDAQCPDELVCRPVIDTSGPLWITHTLCVDPERDGVECPADPECEHVNCALIADAVCD
jgi:hypothetical protein